MRKITKTALILGIVLTVLGLAVLIFELAGPVTMSKAGGMLLYGIFILYFIFLFVVLATGIRGSGKGGKAAKIIGMCAVILVNVLWSLLFISHLTTREVVLEAGGMRYLIKDQSDIFFGPINDDIERFYKEVTPFFWSDNETDLFDVGEDNKLLVEIDTVSNDGYRYLQSKNSNTSAGENICPKINWSSGEVESWAVYMVDLSADNWLHLVDWNLDTNTYEEGALPVNGQYVGPYPPSGTHCYAVFVFGLSKTYDSVPGQIGTAGFDVLEAAQYFGDDLVCAGVDYAYYSAE